MRAKGFCYRLSPGLRYLVDFSRARGCVCAWVCIVRAYACMCVFVCEKGPGMFPIYSDIIGHCNKAFLFLFFGLFFFFLENE